MSATSKQLLARRRRHGSLRKRVNGSAEQPRLAVFRSTKHITAEIIDDVTGRTLAAASTTEKDLRSGATGNIEAAKTIGTRLAERATEAGITKVVFDRGGFLYHGRVAAVAEAARVKGLKF